MLEKRLARAGRCPLYRAIQREVISMIRSLDIWRMTGLALGFAILATSQAIAEPTAREDHVSFGMGPVAPISGRLFGVNYDWNYVPASRYSQYVEAMRGLSHVTVQRFPSGWNAEHYDWNTNTETPWRKSSIQVGASADQVISTSPTTTLITPSKEAISRQDGISTDVEQTLAIVRRFKRRVQVYEIGNEWWLQAGARNDDAIRADNLRHYAQLVAAVVPRILQVDPAAQIYAGVDRRRSQDAAEIREIVGERTWSLVKGVSIHIYCGDDDAEYRCSDIPAEVASIKQSSGKSSVYVSEWNIAPRYTQHRAGLSHATDVGLAIGGMARSGVDLAAYWPPAVIMPNLALVRDDFKTPEANGMLFGWLAEGFRGTMLETTGDLPALAAGSDGAVNLFVFSHDEKPHVVTVDIPAALRGGGASARVMSAASADGRGTPKVSALPLDASAGSDSLTFTLNPGSPDRGSGWEIAWLRFRVDEAGRHRGAGTKASD